MRDEEAKAAPRLATPFTNRRRDEDSGPGRVREVSFTFSVISFMLDIPLLNELQESASNLSLEGNFWNDTWGSI
jgi:hypothetical protein